MSDWRIRSAVPDDAPRLAEFAARTFRDTFEAANNPQDMARHLAASYSPALQREQLESPATRVLIVEHNDNWLAYAQLRAGPVPACVDASQALELWRFYVDRPGIGRGIAQTLMQAVYATATNTGATALWLGVWEHNLRAIAFYRKCGFREVGAHAFHLGDDRQTDLILQRELSTAAYR